MTRQNEFLDVIKNIPDQIGKQIEKINLFQDTLVGLKKSRIIVVASGSSLNSAANAKTFAEEKLNIHVDLYYPNYFFNHILQSEFDKTALYVFISQGGKTKTVLETVDFLVKSGAQVVTLTESLTSPIAQASTRALPIGSENEPFMFRTAGYSLSVVSLCMMFLVLSRNFGDIDERQLRSYLQDLNQVSKDMKNIIPGAEKWYVNNKEGLIDKDAFYFAGGGSLWATAQEAAIKFMEMLPVVTNSFEIEEIIHGPQNSFKDDIGFFLMAEGGVDLEKAEQIQSFIKNEISENVYLLSSRDSSSEIVVKTTSKYFYSLVYITIIQVLSFYLSNDKKRDLSKTKFPQITKYINKQV